MSVFHIQYSLFVDNVQISATTNDMVNIEAVASKIADVTNPHGKAYEVSTNYKCTFILYVATPYIR